jgi:hypothetical protein
MLFTRYDFGQMLTVDGKRYGNSCLLLCLAAQTKLNPSDLALYFATRAHMLNDVTALYDKNELLRDSWANFCHPSPSPNFVHLASSFPRTQTQDWAGSFSFGTIIDFHHISLLCPSEICNSSILFITDDSTNDIHDINISVIDAPNKVAYFPPKEITSDTTPTCIIILHRNNHYTLLAPLTYEHDTIDRILIILGESASNRQFPFIPSKYSQDTPNIARIVGLSSHCLDIDGLRVSHQLMCKDIRDSSERSQPPQEQNQQQQHQQQQQHELQFQLQLQQQQQRQQQELQPATTSSAPLHFSPQTPNPPPQIPFIPSPLPGSKHCRVADDPGSAETAHTASRPRDVEDSPLTLNAMSLSSTSPPAQADHRAPLLAHDDGGVDCDLLLEPSQELDSVTPFPSSEASSTSSAAVPPPWPIDRIIRCTSLAVDERPRPDSPTNARNLRYLVHRPHLSNTWASYNIVRMTAACDRFMIQNEAITGHVFSHVFPPSSGNTTYSNTSSLDLGELVASVITPANESRFQFQLGSRGNVSSDTTSVSGSYSASGIGSQVSSSFPRSLDSTGSFHPHLMNTVAYPNFRSPSCSNRICGSMTYGCFHQNNHACDFTACGRQIAYAEFGWHCPHCDRDYCITCCPVPWEPVSSILSDTPSTQNPGTQELLSDDAPPFPVTSHSQAGSKV